MLVQTPFMKSCEWDTITRMRLYLQTTYSTHHPTLYTVQVLRLCVCIVRMWCFGSGFSFFSSFATDLACVLNTCIFMYTLGCQFQVKCTLYNYAYNVHVQYMYMFMVNHKPVLFRRKIAALCGIQTHDLQHYAECSYH